MFVGTELLLGHILNTNAQFLSQRLAEAGIDVYRQTVVGDNPGRLAAAVREALGRAEVLITSGGLGPTSDDLTRETVAAVLGLELREDPAGLAAIRSFFAERGRPMPPINAKQALVPEGGWALPNRHGTAPGVLVEHQGRVVVMLPGPPHELEPMFDESVLPYLVARLPAAATIVSRVLRLCGIGESEVQTRLADLIEAQDAVTIAPLASPGEVKLRLTTKAATREAGLMAIGPVEESIRARLGRQVYGVDDQTLAGATAGLLLAQGLTLAVAESCTGGLLGAQLTEVPGISAAFWGGVIAYANDLKAGLLGVPAELLAQRGAVSREVTAAMAAGVRRATGAGLGLAISGIAGPGGGTADKPVGLVYLAIHAEDWPEAAVQQWRFRGSRQVVRLRAVRQALVMLRDYLLDRGGTA